MNKFVLAALAACAFLLGILLPSDADAQRRFCRGEVMCKAYNVTVKGAGNPYYGPDYRYDRGYYNGYDQPVVIYRKRKVKHGDTCYAPDGSMFGFGKDRGWYRLTGPSRSNATQVGVSCDQFSATMPEPAPEYGSAEPATSSFYKNGMMWVCERSGRDNLCTPLPDASAQPARAVRKAQSILPPPEPPVRRQSAAREQAPQSAPPADLTVDQVTGKTGTLADYPAE